MIEAKSYLKLFEPFEVRKTIKLPERVENFVQQTTLLTAKLLAEEGERGFAIPIYIAPVYLIHINRSAEWCKLHGKNILLDGAHADTDAQFVAFHHLVDLFCQIIHVVVMVTVSEQSVQIFVAYKCVLVYRHI